MAQPTSQQARSSCDNPLNSSLHWAAGITLRTMMDLSATKLASWCAFALETGKCFDSGPDGCRPGHKTGKASANHAVVAVQTRLAHTQAALTSQSSANEGWHSFALSNT